MPMTAQIDLTGYDCIREAAPAVYDTARAYCPAPRATRFLTRLTEWELTERLPAPHAAYITLLHLVLKDLADERHIVISLNNIGAFLLQLSQNQGQAIADQVSAALNVVYESQ